MADWLLLIVALAGPGKLDQINVSRHATIETCETEGVKQTKRLKARATFTCFQVAPLPGGKKRLNPVIEKK